MKVSCVVPKLANKRKLAGVNRGWEMGEVKKALARSE